MSRFASVTDRAALEEFTGVHGAELGEQRLSEQDCKKLEAARSMRPVRSRPPGGAVQSV